MPRLCYSEAAASSSALSSHGGTKTDRRSLPARARGRLGEERYNLNDLPREACRIIYDSLDLDSRLALSQVSRQLRRAGNDPSLWQSHLRSLAVVLREETSLSFERHMRRAHCQYLEQNSRRETDGLMRKALLMAEVVAAGWALPRGQLPTTAEPWIGGPDPARYSMSTAARVGTGAVLPALGIAVGWAQGLAPVFLLIRAMQGLIVMATGAAAVALWLFLLYECPRLGRLDWVGPSRARRQHYQITVLGPLLACDRHLRSEVTRFAEDVPTDAAKRARRLLAVDRARWHRLTDPPFAYDLERVPSRPEGGSAAPA